MERHRVSHDLLESAVRLVLKNPYALTPLEQARRDDAVGYLQSAEQELPAVLRSLCDAGRATLAQHVLLALGHVEARSRDEISLSSRAAFLSKERVPASIAADLNAPMLYRIAAAADRVNVHLTAFRGRSEAAQRIRREAWTLCFGNSLEDVIAFGPLLRGVHVLILGESGTGKEGIAQAIAAATLVDDAPPVRTTNVAAIPASLAESLLFGHEKGAFTDAKDRVDGEFQKAHGGCLVLDEVADLDPLVQPKLLRAIQQKEVQRLGGKKPEPADVRLLSLTSRDVNERVRSGLFREDLYHRVAVHEIRIPPLRDRRGDIYEIGHAYLQEQMREGARQVYVDRMTEALRWLEAEAWEPRSWAGNVRTVQNELRRFVLGLVQAGDALRPADAQPPAVGKASSAEDASVHDEDRDWSRIKRGEATLAEVKDWYIRHVLHKHEGKLSEAARSLGVHRGTIANARARS